MTKTNIVFIVSLICAVIFSFDANRSVSQVTDIDGNVYKTVKIGTQEWMAENLTVERYRNGDRILTIDEKNKTSQFDIGAWCYYDNNAENGKTYGKLYDWDAVNDSRGLAPEGWHIPSDAEWAELINFLGGENAAGGKLKAASLWQKPNSGANDEYGFCALPGGFLSYRLDFFSLGESCSFWSSTKANDKLDIRAWCRQLFYNKTSIERSDLYKSECQSVRCVKDTK